MLLRSMLSCRADAIIERVEDVRGIASVVCNHVIDGISSILVVIILTVVMEIRIARRSVLIVDCDCCGSDGTSRCTTRRKQPHAILVVKESLGKTRCRLRIHFQSLSAEGLVRLEVRTLGRHG